MDDILPEVKQRLSIDAGFGQAELNILLELLSRAGPQTLSVLKWVFAEHQGYTDTRVYAGNEVLKADPIEGWRILKRLVASHNPDDCDVALELLKGSSDPRAYPLVRPLLGSVNNPGLQLEVAVFLKDIYPSAVISTLQRMIDYHERVAQSARTRLDSLAGKAESG